MYVRERGWGAVLPWGACGSDQPSEGSWPQDRPGSAGRAAARRAEERDGGAGGRSPVVQHVVDQVDEVQPQLRSVPSGRDAVAEWPAIQFAVRAGLGVAEHQFFPACNSQDSG